MKKRTITYIIAIIVLIAIIISIFVVKNKSSNNESEMKTITVNEVTRSVFYAPQYVAINNGYFEENGMEIGLSTGQGADAVMTAVLSGQCDIGQVFAQMTKRDGSFLVAKEDTDNFSWQDLKGKTVIPGRKGGVPYMTLEYVLKKNGINPETDLTLDDSIKFDLMAGAFSSGDAEYVTLFEPTASLTEKEGKGYVVASVGEASGEIPYTAYFAKKSYIENNEDTIQKFTNAIYKGQKYVKEHTSTEIAEVIQSFFPDTDIEQLANAVQSYKDIDAWNETPVLKEEAYHRLEEVMTMAGELQEKAPYEKVINNKYAEQVQ